MNRCKKVSLTLLLASLCMLFFTSCGSSKRAVSGVDSPDSLSKKLGVRVTKSDNLYLYTEASKWIGTPYRSGGNTRKGADCSGFTSQIYKDVYNKQLARTSADQLSRNCKRVSRSKLREGDLVFFNTTGKNKKTPTHVGLYLKNGKFIHASTSKGVIVSSLSENYYVRSWITGGRVK